MTNKAETDQCPYGPRYQVYWNMRYALFSRFDEAKVDAAGLYTMVPEKYALAMARRASGKRVLDICSGIGSISIAFARCGQQVTGVEIDENRVAMARHNARLYGVADKIDFLVADITSDMTLESLPADIDSVFLDPPWGKEPGDYQRRPVTRLQHLELAGMDLRTLVEKIDCHEVFIRLPPNFNLDIFRNVTGDKVAFTTKAGQTHWFFVRTTKQQFVDLPDG
ncbi:MAG: trimethylguanosine synthase [Xanthomonadales bacterium]|nr:trimethylguanosine synthase [Xanthomonadales bacterium]